MSDTQTGKKVFVGLSGGVDSAVSAALLKEEGYKVTGVFIETWHPDFLPCTWREDRREAMRVAAHLNIPFLSLNLSDVYRKDVGDYFIREYARGRTPNPDVLCNRAVKFGAFAQFAKEHGADFVATGHYAQIVSDASELQMHKGQDSGKDQSYFLWMLEERELVNILFPVGSYTKPQVRKLAEKYNLPNATRKDSQGICFLGAVDLFDFLKRFIPLEDGEVLDVSGNAIGTHKGAALYTVGERHGFTVKHATSEDTPLYVTYTDIASNTVTVGEMTDIPSRTTYLLADTVFAADCPDGSYETKIRYRGELLSCELRRENGQTKVIFAEPQSIALGQSVVLYKGTRLIGGGVADSWV